MVYLKSPKDIEIQIETQQLISQVSEALLQFNKLRPLTPDTEQRIKLSFLPDRVTASLNMEGIVATRRQTLAIMDAMTLTDSSQHSEREICNALKADEFVFESANEKVSFSEKFVREIHSLIEDKIGECPGQYRPRDVQISQASFTPPRHDEVSNLMKELVQIFLRSDSVDTILRAAWLHSRFTFIHPFLDGNGRTARLLQDFVLLQGGLFPTGVPSSIRDDYYDALAEADKDNWDSLITILARRQLAVISKATGIANERKDREQWIVSLANRAKEKKKGSQHKNYLVWAHKMGEVQSSFEAAATELSSASDELTVHHENLDMIDFQQWLKICQKGAIQNTWFFTQTFLIDGERHFKCVFYFRRHTIFPQDTFQGNYDIVSLFVTGGGPYERYDFSRFMDTEIKLRELTFVDDKLFHYYFKGEQIPGKYGEKEKWIPSDSKTTNELVKEFYEDVFLRKLGV